MQRVESTRNIDALAQRALAGGGIAGPSRREDGMHGRAERPAGSRRQQKNLCEILQRPAQIIQLMRLDHVDAHLNRDGCDVLARAAIDASKWPGLQAAPVQVMGPVGQGNYHCALMELQTISQPKWHTC